MDKVQSIINLKIKELEDFKRQKFTSKNNTSSKRVINGKIGVLVEILKEIKKYV